MATSRADKRKTRSQVRADAERARRRRLYLIGGAIALALIVAGGLIWSNRDSSNLPGLREADAAALANIPTDGRIIGDSDAPVHLVEYGDYQCPACASFSQTVFPTLLSDYIGTGKVSFEFRDLAFLGDDSVTAAEAAACSIDQGGYWLYHDTIYANHFGENLGNLSKSRLLQMAKLAGLDQDKISNCIDAGTNLAEVKSMHQEANQLGLTSTPSFVLNGQVIQWQGWDAMKQAIDAALAQQ
jgi:protein-disulfide isomerase